MKTVEIKTLLRRIPKVDQILLRPAVSEWVARTGRDFVVTEIRKLLDEIRVAIQSDPSLADEITKPERVETILSEKLEKRLFSGLREVLNATGVILHTNLGRAPLSAPARKSLDTVSVQYANLEYDIAEGNRSHRDKLIQPLLRETLGCEAAAVVNNNAAAVFLILNTLAYGKEVIVSRGELVEIGGSFRVSEIMSRSGAILREVGTTNKTRLSDYENAITSETALLMKVHPSNFTIRGFTEKPGLNELVELSRRSGIPLVEDIGSGCLVDLRPYGIPDEPKVQESLEAGVDLVSFSGDKLLGGPQAGIIAGVEKLVAPIRKNPFMRTYRVDKLVYGALQATLDSYRFGRAETEIPVLRMITMPLEEITRRARNFARRLRAALPENVRVRLLDGSSVVGGGACPECFIPTKLIALESDRVRPAVMESRLRAGKPAVIIRVEADCALIDLRTIFPAQESILFESLHKALSHED